MLTVTRKLKFFLSLTKSRNFNGKGKHACNYRANKYGSLLFIGVGGGGGGGEGVV